MNEKSKITKYFQASKRSKLSTTNNAGVHEEVDNELQDEVNKLKEQLGNLKIEKQALMLKVRDAKNELEMKYKQEEQINAEAARVASLTTAEARTEKLNNIRKLFRIFGVEITSTVQDGISATFHHWYKGVRVATNSIAVVEQEEGEIVVQKHSLPPNAVAWMKIVPCVSPHTSLMDTLQDIRKSCIAWHNRYHQLEEFKVTYPNIQVHNSLDLASIIIDAELKEGNGDQNDFQFTLSYDPHSIRPSEVQVEYIQGDADNEEERQEMINDVRGDSPIFKQMALKDAFCFMFEVNEDATKRSLFVKSE